MTGEHLSLCGRCTVVRVGKAEALCYSEEIGIYIS